MTTILGKWKGESQENMEVLLKAIGLPEDKIPVIVSDKQIFNISKDGDYFTFDVTSQITGNAKTKFKEGEPYEAPTLTGGNKTFVATKEGDKVHVRQQDGPLERIYEIVGDKMLLTIKAGDASGKIYFSKV
ncbi:fatty acid-binding protein 1, liver-like [Saccoglossus kowalevskii]|uniref:Fatty acid-binding protein 1, liver-like n=1 Tax=Saccoglossus kowalevskii TaxID=10224 RepID=A0ABM0MPU7_SACKO|nr:PREDICTED: fatty acid-binding protein 1, liver-like [Saccoglossus kowalevskii]